MDLINEDIPVEQEENMDSNTSVIVEALKSMGWEVEVREARDQADLIEVDKKNGLMKCVDGRMSDKVDGMSGPKTLGGVYAIAVMRGVSDLDGLKKIVEEAREMGYVPSVHGDDHAHPAEMGCGFFKLWSSGQLSGVVAPEFGAEEGRQAVLEAGGVLEMLSGHHSEEVVMINTLKDKTLKPNGKRFLVDAWICDEFEIDQMEYLAKAAETVEKLGGPKKAVILV